MKIIDRVLQYIDYKGISRYRFYKDTGLSNGSLDKGGNLGSDKCEKILYAYPDINANWLVTGKGDMLIVSSDIDLQNEKNKRKPLVNKYNDSKERKFEKQLIPLYDIEASAGLVGAFEHHNNPIDQISIPNLSRCDGAIYVRGDSMYPLLKSGDIVCYKQVSCFDYIVYGEMYIISFNIHDEEYVAVKYINKSDEKGCIKLVSQNPHHAPQDIPISSIRALAIVKSSIRFHTMM